MVFNYISAYMYMADGKKQEITMQDIDLSRYPNVKLKTGGHARGSSRVPAKHRLEYIDACVAYVEQIASYEAADLNPSDIYVRAKEIVDKYNRTA